MRWLRQSTWGAGGHLRAFEGAQGRLKALNVAGTLTRADINSPENNVLSQLEKDCLKACQDCTVACLQCASACVKETDVKMMAACIANDLECADICQLAAASIARGGVHAKAICALCAKACQDCAAECGKHQVDHCQHCAQACKRCAEACLAMA